MAAAKGRSLASMLASKLEPAMRMRTSTRTLARRLGSLPSQVIRPPVAQPKSLRARVAHAAALACALAWPATALHAEVPEIYRGADLKLGERLIAEHKCAQCHARKLEGDGNAIYRPKGRINTPGLLRGMVEQCNTELNLGLFPEEVTAIAAVLNRDHYKFSR